jgi:group I intron endonuclease
LIKYGYINFSLDILEYTEKDILLEREQYYIDLINPQYNNLTIAGSSLGYKHTKDTLAKFDIRKVSDSTRTNLAKAATGRVLTEDIKNKISLSRKGIKLSD